MQMITVLFLQIYHHLTTAVDLLMFFSDRPNEAMQKNTAYIAMHIINYSYYCSFKSTIFDQKSLDSRIAGIVPGADKNIS